jgi:hypothetical protein
LDSFVVVVYVGTPRPQLVTRVGPFQSEAAARVWCEHEGFSQEPIEGEWAVVMPQKPGGDESWLRAIPPTSGFPGVSVMAPAPCLFDRPRADTPHASGVNTT